MYQRCEDDIVTDRDSDEFQRAAHESSHRQTRHRRNPAGHFAGPRAAGDAQGRPSSPRPELPQPAFGPSALPSECKTTRAAGSRHRRAPIRDAGPARHTRAGAQRRRLRLAGRAGRQRGPRRRPPTRRGRPALKPSRPGRRARRRHRGRRDESVQEQPRWAGLRPQSRRNAQPESSWPVERPVSAPSNGNYNYVDGLRASELVPARKVPPGRGWRRALYKSASFGLINLGPIADERRQAELEDQDPVAAARPLQDRGAGQGRRRQDHRRRGGRLDSGVAAPGRPGGGHRRRHRVRQAGQPGRPARGRARTGSWPPTSTCIASPTSARGSATTPPGCSCWPARRPPRAAGCWIPQIYREATARLDSHFTHLDRGLRIDDGFRGHRRRCCATWMR